MDARETHFSLRVRFCLFTCLSRYSNPLYRKHAICGIAPATENLQNIKITLTAHLLTELTRPLFKPQRVNRTHPRGAVGRIKPKEDANETAHRCRQHDRIQRDRQIQVWH